jgi:hypothetical protein
MLLKRNSTITIKPDQLTKILEKNHPLKGDFFLIIFFLELNHKFAESLTRFKWHGIVC